MSGMKRRQQQRLKGRGLEGALRTDPQRSGTPLELDNLSRGGLFACSRFALELGAIVWFDLVHPIDRVRFTVEGRVKSVVSPQEALRKGVPAGVGIEFLNLGAVEKARLEELLAWLHDPKAYADRAAARKAAPVKNEHLSAFDFDFKSLTDESDLSWCGTQMGPRPQTTPRPSAAPPRAPGVTAASELERKKLAYVRYLEHERVRLLSELEQKKRQLAQLGHA